jgi:hypothetical protein
MQQLSIAQTKRPEPKKIFSPIIRTKPVAQIIYQKNLLGLLCKYHYSKRQLATLTGIQHTTICRWVETYHRGPQNLVYISKWERSATVGPYTAFYSFGYCMPDVPKPAPLTKKEKNERTRGKLRLTKTSEGIQHVSE